MRAIRTILVVTAAAVGAIGVAATGTTANGGAYLDFGRSGAAGTYFVPGDHAVGSIAVSIPDRRQTLIERGPFLVYLGRGGQTVAEGRPPAGGLVRVATATIERNDGDTFTVRAAFTVPSLARGAYTVSMCNSPCTISGFREPITGYLEVVATPREASLLVERDRLSALARGLKRGLRNTERSTKELQAQLAQAQQDNAWLAEEVNRLNAEVDAAPNSEDGPTRNTWPALALVGTAVLVGATVAVVRRRRLAIRVPDTIEGIEDDRPVAR